MVGDSLEDPTNTSAAGEVVLVIMTVAVAVVVPAGIDEEADFVRNDTVFQADAGEADRPLVAVHRDTAAEVGVGGEAELVDREPENQAAVRVVERGLFAIVVAVAGGRIVVGGDPVPFSADTNVAGEE